ncbi:ribosomal-protein-alanine N-acetyltransferase [Sarcina sp. DSM 11001]|uniref:ribosomal protein S18-alanine N-acetyltransferase n=1 Tax=Sarcina sp. DSM 11001 TaxID=1798184 RepID=UPI00087FBCC4|nr:ribosomal protein S18-alanine N-acetyltransferase [Sarcina sp. DSM 11001]SDL33643.1 ribosomal-protein-alanine N-acetyltransferase [Sarcina sp. DSM 11001]
MSVIVRRMREEDIPQAVEIEKAAFTRPWSKSIFKATLLLPYAAYYVAVEQGTVERKTAEQRAMEEETEEQGALKEETAEQRTLEQGALEQGENQEPDQDRIVGICGVKKIFEEGEISNVAVHPDCRGRGISRRMLEMLIREAREDGVESFTLEVRAGNRTAIRLYESFGFRTEGVRPRFYDHPVEDGLIMWLRK